MPGMVPPHMLEGLRRFPLAGGMAPTRTGNEDIRVKFKGFVDMSGTGIGIHCHFGKKFLWRPMKINDKWHWLISVWVKVDTTRKQTAYNFGHDYHREYMLEDDFLVYKLANDLTATSEPI